ncbi:MAG: PIN domain-containing protein [Myxococcaceae bacterium]
MKVLLDTNAYVRMARGEAVVAEPLKEASRVVISAVVAGELIQGFRGGTRYAANIKALLGLLHEPSVEFLPISLVTAEHYGRIAADLKRRGRPIPHNDIWIAAHCFQAGTELWSFDRHFENVEGLVWRRLSH